MPVKRRQPKQLQHRITPEAIAAFTAGEHMALHRELGLRPWEESPLDVTVEEPPTWWNRPLDDWQQAWELRQELIAAAETKAKPAP